MIDAETKRDIEDLKRQLKIYEDEEAQLLKELEVCRARKTEVKDKLKVLEVLHLSGSCRFSSSL